MVSIWRYKILNPKEHNSTGSKDSLMENIDIHLHVAEGTSQVWRMQNPIIFVATSKI